MLMHAHSRGLWRSVLIAANLVLAAEGLPEPAPGPGSPSVPPDGRIRITDYGYRDWAAALLHYRIDDARFKVGPVALVDAAGQPVPAQIDPGLLSFVAALSKGQTMSFHLDGGTPATSSLQVSVTQDAVEVRNEFFGLRMPPTGERDYKSPEDAAKVPAPLTAWRPAGEAWMGASRFVTSRKVRRTGFKILKNGPACFEYEARYAFDPDGTYVCRITVAPGIDYADVVDEYDFSAHTEGRDFLLVELQRGLQPATLGWVVPGAELGPGTTDRKAVREYLAARLNDGANRPAPVGGSGLTPMPPQPEPDMVLLDKIVPGGKWGGLKGGVELRGVLTDATQPPAARVSILPLHTGSWRRSLAMTVWHGKDAGVCVALPISTRKCTWYTECTDDISPFSTHEHDAGLPPSYGRRNWALYFGAMPETLQGTAGYIGLDEYKNWILDWPETTKPEDHPRAWFTRADVAELRKSLDRHPDKAALSRYFVFSGQTEDAVRHAREFAGGIVSQHGYLGNWYVGGLSHYRQSQALMPAAHLADDALACPDLPPELRKEVRRTLALSAYLMSSPDLNPRGAGVHLGNNNMSINRTCALAYSAGCLPDHPEYLGWMENVTAHVAYKLGSQVAHDGASIECPTYWLYGPLRFLEPAITIIRNTGGPDFAPYQARSLQYFANLTVPDPRFNGRRIIPGMGNSGNILESIFGSTLATSTRGAPAQARFMQWLHRAAWPTQPLGTTPSNCNWFAFQYRPDIPGEPTGLGTCIMPTYGVVFRNRFGTPDETTVLFRAGINWSHWDTDAGNVILYAKGASLSPGTGYQYYNGAANENEGIYHNRVKVGARNQQEVFGRVDDAITDYGLNPNADYAVNSRFYPSQLFRDGKGAMHWNRHVLFLKGTSDYLVLRDTFPGGVGRPTWWTWLNLGTADAIRVEGRAFDKEKTPVDKAVPEDQMPAQRGREVELGTAFGAGTWMWFANAEPLVFRARLTFTASNLGLLGLKPEEFPKQDAKETKTILEAAAKPGEDYFYVVYPRKEGEAAPPCERIHKHGLRIRTAESTDLVFIADESVTFEEEGVVFSGKAGAVRIFADRVSLGLYAGTGRVGYKGMIFEGSGPFEKTVRLDDIRAGAQPVPEAYEKRRIAVDAGGGVQVEGEGPFDAKLDGRKIVLTVRGRARVLYVTRPEWIWQPWGTVDGQPWMVCWTDYPASGWGRYDRTNLMAVSVPEGPHTIELSDRTFPPCWPRRFEPAIRPPGKR